MFLARKFSRSKWDDDRNLSRGLSRGEISADAVTGDLRTRQDALSFWRCHAGAVADIEDAVLAIAAAAERVAKVDIVWVDEEALRSDGHPLRDSPGRTPVADLAERHVDICQLDYVRLGRLAQKVDAAVREKHWRRISKARVKALLASAIEQGRIVPGELNARLRADMEK